MKAFLKWVIPYNIVMFYHERIKKEALQDQNLYSPIGPDGIRLINYDMKIGWILSKFANKLYHGLLEQGKLVDIAACQDSTASVNHHIIYFEATQKKSNIETLMITHIDTVGKLEKLRTQQSIFDMGICMSSETVETLVKKGIRRDWLCYVNPAHDFVIKPRPICFGILSKVHPDGRKNENFLAKLFCGMDVTRIKIKIMGEGWDNEVAKLRKMNFDVQYIARFDYELYQEIVPSLDYFLYFSWDEGSMSYLDAIAADVKTVVTPQGFHLDVENGIDLECGDFSSLKEALKTIFIKQDSRIDRVGTWTWNEYAWHHSIIWDFLHEKRDLAFQKEVLHFLQEHSSEQHYSELSADCNLDMHTKAAGLQKTRIARFFAYKAFIYTPKSKIARSLLK